MQKAKEVVLILSLIFNIYLCWKIWSEPNNEITKSGQFVNKIDSLELVISELETKKDSIKNQINYIDSSLIKVEYVYEEISNTIISNTTSDNFKLFSEYLEWNRKRLDSINNSKSIKGD